MRESYLSIMNVVYGCTFSISEKIFTYDCFFPAQYMCKMIHPNRYQRKPVCLVIKEISLLNLKKFGIVYEFQTQN